MVYLQNDIDRLWFDGSIVSAIHFSGDANYKLGASTNINIDRI